MPVGLIARLKVKPDKTAEFEAAFCQFQQTVRSSEPGVVYFGLHRSQTEAGCYSVMEQYRDEAALAAHRNTPHYLAIPTTFGEFMAGPPELEVFDAIE